MRDILYTGQYKKDLKLAIKRGLPEHKLTEIIIKLANDEELPPSNRDHVLHGNYEGLRECHVLPDWLLIYSKSEDGEVQIITLYRTGSHSDLF